MNKLMISTGEKKIGMQTNRVKLFHSVGIFSSDKHEIKVSNSDETPHQKEVSQSK